MAGASTQDVKRRIKSVSSMERITNAMKLVSSSKLRKARATFDNKDSNLRYIIHALNEVFMNTNEIPDKYMEHERRIVGKTCYIVITGNKGLCGSFNSNIIKETEKTIAEDNGEAVIVAIGKKGKDYFEKRGYEVAYGYSEPLEEVDFLKSKALSTPVINMYNNGEIDKVVFIGTRFINSMSFEMEKQIVLPFEMPKASVKASERIVDYAPSVEAVFDYLVPKHIQITLYEAIIDSAACEHSARRIAMENATDSAREMLGELTLSYNRARQAAITDEIIEIVSGSEAQRQ